MSSTHKTVFAYYFLYKFIQQNVYIEILKSENGVILTGFWSRIIALILNFVHSSITEHFFTSKTSRKVLLSVYTSLHIILLFTSKQMGILEISFFVLNLTLCESIVFRDFLQLWQIQLCLELSILTNYITCHRISMYVGGVFIPIYLLWIFSVLLSTSAKAGGGGGSGSGNKHESQLVDSTTHTIIIQCDVNDTIKTIVYTSLQATLSVSYLLIGCTTIRNTIFGIFHTDQFTLFEVVILMLIICILVLSACILIKFQRKTKLIIIIILVLVNYFAIFIIDHQLSPIIPPPSYKHQKYIFLVKILLKKVLSMCKCCISSFLLKNYRQITYKGIRFRMIKFYILNADTISFVINMLIHDTDVNLLNIFIVIISVVLYNLFNHI